MSSKCTTSITIDDREHSLYAQLEPKCLEKGVPLLKTTLPLGDLILRYGDASENTPSFEFVLERKTLTDLLASIRDGRYEEQSHRLIHASGVPRHNIIYVVEGIINTVTTNEKNLIHSTMVSLNAFKGFSIIRTSTVQETADFVFNMACKIQRNMEKNKLPWFLGVDTPERGIGTIVGGEDGVPEPIPYCNVVKKVKKDNVTASNIGEIVLCQIPGISSVSAVAIMSKFQTIKRLIEEVSRDPNCMNDIVITSANGGTRKISKTIVFNILKYLCTNA